MLPVVATSHALASERVLYSSASIVKGTKPTTEEWIEESTLHIFCKFEGEERKVSFENCSEYDRASVQKTGRKADLVSRSPFVFRNNPIFSLLSP